MLYIIILIIILLAILAIGWIIIYNKFQLAIIKINEAENNIDILLEKKLELLLRVLTILQEKKTKDLDILLKISEPRTKLLDHFDLRSLLEKAFQELNLILDTNNKLSNMDSIQIIYDELVDNDCDLDAAVRFYNDNVSLYNQLIKCIPSNLVAFFLHFKTKEFYSKVKEEELEILKK